MEKFNLREKGLLGIDELVKEIGKIKCNEEVEKVDEQKEKRK